MAVTFHSANSQRVGRACLGRAAVAVAVLAWAVVPAGSAARQAPQSAFEVASVKSNRGGATSVEWRWQNGRLTAVNVTLKMLIATAYGSPQQPLPDRQIIGGPRWVDSDRYDVLAVEPPAEPGGGSTPEGLGRLRTFLEQRFQLKAHFESRDQPIYALVRANGNGTFGQRLRPRTVDCAAVAAGVATGERCGGQIFPGNVSARGITMTQFVSGLARLMPNVDRNVVDRTGLTGTFDLDLSWTPDPSLVGAGATVMPMPGAPAGVQVPPVDPNGPSLFTALQEQLGLRLESTSGPVRVLIIDAVARPSED